MSARVPARLSRRGALLLLGAAIVGGCERSGPQPAGNQAARAADGRPVTATRPALPLRDWVTGPQVDEAEREAPALRIVSAAPNVTEICCALGLRERLVGRTRYCDYPPGIEQVPAIGALIDVNVEHLLELRPDLILVSGTSRAQTERLAATGLRFESVPDATLADIFAAVRRIGELTGRIRTAERLCAGMEADLRAVSDHFAGTAPARVLLLLGPLSDPPRPPYAAGPGSFYDDLLRRAGHRNVVADAAAAFAMLSLEFIVQADPDVILELAPDDRSRPGGEADALQVWGKLGPLRAVTARRVHVLVGSEHFVAGPRIALTYAALCRAIADEGHD